MKTFNWATLGCGVIANQLAQALQAQGRNLYSVANRTHEKAIEFAKKYNIEKNDSQISMFDTMSSGKYNYDFKYVDNCVNQKIKSLFDIF